MSTLQRVMYEVPALRNALPVDSLNVLSLVCRELNESTRLSESYRRHYLEKDKKLRPRNTQAFACPTQVHPSADFKRASHGMAIFHAQYSLNPPTTTSADVQAQRYFLRLVCPSDLLESVERIVELTQLAKKVDWYYALQKRKKRRNTAIGMGLGIGLSLATGFGLFISSTVAAAVAVLSFLAALYYWRWF